MAPLEVATQQIQVLPRPREHAGKPALRMASTRLVPTNSRALEGLVERAITTMRTFGASAGFGPRRLRLWTTVCPCQAVEVEKRLR